ncbi:MAG: ABC transporter ATP-binding protein [Elusimicrobia bacterium]|nr:ABC transporter ATP-binding protein [Elusimicrobiota bacterium]
MSLALGVGIFEAIGVGLMVPLAQGLVGMDFSFLSRTKAFRMLQELLPGISFSPSAAFVCLALAIFLSFVLKNILQYGSSVAVARLVRQFANGLRKLIFRRYLTFGKIFFDKNNAGHLHGVVISTVEKLVTRLSDLHYFFAGAFTLIAYLGIMMYISVKLTAALIFLLPVLNLSLAWIIPRVRRASASFSEAQGAMSKALFNALSCIPLIKAYCGEEQESEIFGRKSDEVARFEFGMDRNVLIVLPLQEVIMLGLVLLLVSVMAFIVARQGTARLPGFLVYFYVLRRAASSFSVVSHIKATLSAITGPLDELDGIFDDSGKHFVPSGQEEFPGLKSLIEFKAVDFSYADGPRILKRVSFSVERGQMTAIVGPSGTGKSTIASLLSRFYDSAPGCIMIDGRDIRSFTLKSLRRHMALVSQDTSLFNDSLRVNITYGLRPVPTDEALDTAVRKARLTDFVSRLPDGFETVIGDRGVQLSGGEKQRVSIARALLKGSDVLILDEATSALDTKTEQLIQEALDEMIGGKTAVVIAHRLSTIRKAHKILVVEGGEIVEEGSLSKLLEMRGRFHQYWEAQKFF